jgi:hypothetical protein
MYDQPLRNWRGVKTGPAPRAFLGDDHSVLADLATPYAEGLGPLERPRQARPAERAAAAVGLGLVELGRDRREPQPRILTLAGDRTPGTG